jgi:hypothetical protein
LVRRRHSVRHRNLVARNKARSGINLADLVRNLAGSPKAVPHRKISGNWVIIREGVFLLLGAFHNPARHLAKSTSSLIS